MAGTKKQRPKDGEIRFAGFVFKGFPHTTNRFLVQYEAHPKVWTALEGPFTGRHFDAAELDNFSIKITDPGPETA